MTDPAASAAAPGRAAARGALSAGRPREALKAALIANRESTELLTEAFGALREPRASAPGALFLSGVAAGDDRAGEFEVGILVDVDRRFRER